MLLLVVALLALAVRAKPAPGLDPSDLADIALVEEDVARIKRSGLGSGSGSFDLLGGLKKVKPERAPPTIECFLANTFHCFFLCAFCRPFCPALGPPRLRWSPAAAARRCHPAPVTVAAAAAAAAVPATAPATVRPATRTTNRT